MPTLASKRFEIASFYREVSVNLGNHQPAATHNA
jgi:hypothetical protein